MKRIIIVEDDTRFRDCVVEYLTLDGYSVTGIGSAMEFYREIGLNQYSLAVIDVGLPDQSGLILVEFLRKNTNMPVLMLSALVLVDDRVAGYAAGADIYMGKPVDFRELAAGIDSLLRRSETPALAPDPVLHGACDRAWHFERSEWTLRTPAGDPIKLTTKEFSFLNCIASQENFVVSRELILEKLDYPNNEYGRRALESLVHRLRSKTSITGKFPLKTAHGSGYCFSEPLVVE